MSIEEGPKGTILLNDSRRANPSSTVAGLVALKDLPAKRKIVYANLISKVQAKERTKANAALAAPIASPKSFDGGWSVLIVTEKGTCDRAYRYPIKIENGAVGYAGGASFTVSGKVDPKGAVTVTVARGSQSATGTGVMSGSAGTGAWTAASGECSGTWTAERRS